MRHLGKTPPFRTATFLIVTHDISVGRATDRMVRKIDGQIVEEERLEVRNGRASDVS